jgi:hypothetical protein
LIASSDIAASVSSTPSSSPSSLDDDALDDDDGAARGIVRRDGIARRPSRLDARAGDDAVDDAATTRATTTSRHRRSRARARANDATMADEAKLETLRRMLASATRRDEEAEARREVETAARRAEIAKIAAQLTAITGSAPATPVERTKKKTAKATTKATTTTKTKTKTKAKAKAKKVKAKKTVKPKRSANDPLKTSDFAVGMEVEVRGEGNETWYGEVTKVRQSNAKCPLEVAWLQKEGSGFIYYDCAHKDVIELRTVLETHEAGHFAVPAGGRSACSKCKEAGTTCSKRVKK